MTSPTPEITDEAGGSGGPARDRAWRIFVIPAVLALVGYLALYALDAHLRQRHGPWVVEFEAGVDGTPGLRISQAALGITDVVVRFAGERLTNPAVALPATVRAIDPERLGPAPFGRIAFHDLTYLPGTLVLHCFGHEVQMLPKALYLNRQAHPWASGAAHLLSADGKLPSLDPPVPPKRPLMIPSMGPPGRRATEPGSEPVSQ